MFSAFAYSVLLPISCSVGFLGFLETRLALTNACTGAAVGLSLLCLVFQGTSHVFESVLRIPISSHVLTFADTSEKIEIFVWDLLIFLLLTIVTPTGILQLEVPFALAPKALASSSALTLLTREVFMALPVLAFRDAPKVLVLRVIRVGVSLS